MITSCEIIHVPAQPIVALHQQIPAAEAKRCMGSGVAEVRSALASQGISRTGPWLTLHFKVPDATWDFSICEMVADDAAFKTQGRVAASSIPAGKIARCVYVGGYEGLASGWMEFMKWVEGKGEKARMAGFWEVYTVNPDNSEQGQEFRTELNCPVE